MVGGERSVVCRGLYRDPQEVENHASKSELWGTCSRPFPIRTGTDVSTSRYQQRKIVTPPDRTGWREGAEKTVSGSLDFLFLLHSSNLTSTSLLFCYVDISMFSSVREPILILAFVFLSPCSIFQTWTHEHTSTGPPSSSSYV